MLRIMSVICAFGFILLLPGCGGTAGQDSGYDGSIGRDFRQSQAEAYNMQQSIYGTGKAVAVPLY